jgi:hypothetical protein
LFGGNDGVGAHSAWLAPALTLASSIDLLASDDALLQMSLICDSLCGVCNGGSILQQRRDIASTVLLGNLITQLLTGSHVALMSDAVNTRASSVVRAATAASAARLTSSATIAAMTLLFNSVFRLASQSYVTPTLPAGSFLKVNTFFVRFSCQLRFEWCCHVALVDSNVITNKSSIDCIPCMYTSSVPLAWQMWYNTCSSCYSCRLMC